MKNTKLNQDELEKLNVALSMAWGAIKEFAHKRHDLSGEEFDDTFEVSLREDGDNIYSLLKETMEQSFDSKIDVQEIAAASLRRLGFRSFVDDFGVRIK